LIEKQALENGIGEVSSKKPSREASNTKKRSMKKSQTLKGHTGRDKRKE
jgi:hypothetical protein